MLNLYFRLDLTKAYFSFILKMVNWIEIWASGWPFQLHPETDFQPGHWAIWGLVLADTSMTFSPIMEMIASSYICGCLVSMLIIYRCWPNHIRTSNRFSKVTIRFYLYQYINIHTNEINYVFFVGGFLLNKKKYSLTCSWHPKTSRLTSCHRQRVGVGRVAVSCRSCSCRARGRGRWGNSWIAGRESTSSRSWSASAPSRLGSGPWR